MMLREVKALLGNRSIQGLAPSVAAARVLGYEAGIEATTLQWFPGDSPPSLGSQRAREGRRFWRDAS